MNTLPLSRRLTSEQIESWVQEFLRGPGGNLGFADGLNLDRRAFFGPLTLPLADLSRCCGPEPFQRYRVPVESFERRVAGLRAFRIAGGLFPPLIVNFTGGKFELNDGNHRWEALHREGVPQVSVVVWTTGESDKDAFLRRYGPWLEVEAAYEEGLVQGRQGVMACLIRRADGRIFAQRRSPTRKTFPGCWDLVGGHVEPGESPRQALVRELREETGWTLDRVDGLRKVVDWETPGEGKVVQKREFVLAVSIQGDEDNPVLEEGKVTEGRWFGPEDLDLLNENRGGLDTYVYDLVREELARTSDGP